MHWTFESKGKKGRFEIRTTWLPYFLAADVKMIQNMDASLTEKFGGEERVDRRDIDREIISIITKRHPIPGLDKYLRALWLVRLEGHETEDKEELD